MQRRFATLDVFTDRRFTGNPLAVVLDAEALDTTAMQAIAREFGHPETVFVFAPADATHHARVRIFTPARELQFAGHPTVGTAVLLGLRDGAAAGRELILEEAIGPVRCTLEASGSGAGRARFALPQLPAEAGPASDNASIAATLSLAPSDIGESRPARWSAGNPFTFVPLVTRAAVARCRPNLDKFEAAFGPAVYVFCREPVEPAHQFYARMFAPGMGVAEDPATGSAAAAFAGLLASGLGDGTHTTVIEQGYDMGRPSLIHLTTTVEAGRLVSAAIGGDAVVVTEGTLEA